MYNRTCRVKMLRSKDVLDSLTRCHAKLISVDMRQIQLTFWRGSQVMLMVRK